MIHIISPSISVIIPLYNKAPYIKRAIDSVLRQTIQDFEIIIVGGNSNDGGEEIVKKYTDSRIIFVKEEGRGVSTARNQAVRIARASIIAFLDADDEWELTHLEDILNLKKEYPYAGLYVTGHNLITDDANVPRIYNSKKGSRLLKSYFSERVTAGIRNQFIITSAIAVNKQIFMSIGGFNIHLSYGEDNDLYERMSVITKIAYSPEVSVRYYYDIPENTRTHVVFRKPLTSERMDLLWESIQNINNNELKKDFLKYRDMNNATGGFANALRGHRKESIVLLKKVRSLKYLHIIVGAMVLNLIPRKIQIKLMWRYYRL